MVMTCLALLNLPSEVLKEIFLCSDNPNLIFFIDQKLFDLIHESPAVRKHLIKICCHNASLSEEIPNNAHNALHQLMKQDWLTVGQILEVAYNWFDEVIEHEIQKTLTSHGLPYCLLPDFLAQVQSTLQARRREPRQTKNVGGAYAHTESLAVDLGSHQCYFDVDYTTISFATYPRDYFRGRLEDRSRYIAPQQTLHFIPPLCNRGIFPSQLVRGPWTQRDGDLLTFFVSHFKTQPSGKTIYGRGSEQRAAFTAGIQRALEEQNMPALATLAGGMRRAFCPHNPPTDGFICLPTESLIPQNDKQVNRSRWTRVRTPMLDFTVSMTSDYEWNNHQMSSLLKWANSASDTEIGQTLALHALCVMRLRTEPHDMWQNDLARGFATVAYGEDEDDWRYNRAFEYEDKEADAAFRYRLDSVYAQYLERRQLRDRVEDALDAMDRRSGPKKNMLRSKSADRYFDEDDKIEKYWCDNCQCWHEDYLYCSG